MLSPDDAHQFRYLCRLLSFGPDATFDKIDPTAPDADERWRETVSAAFVPGLLPAVCHRRLPRYAEICGDPPAVVLSDNECQVRHILSEHRYRCHTQHSRLREAITALNAPEIVPMLMTGSRAIWLQDPAWQFVQRLGLGIPASHAQPASAALQKLGYREVRPIDPSGFRRERHFYRPDLSGVLALRGLGSHGQVDRSLAGNEISSHSRIVLSGGARAHLPAAHIAIVFDLLHRHNRRPACGASVITLKELYEFSWALSALDSDESSALQTLVLKDPHIGPVLTAWYTEAKRLFRLEQPWLDALDGRLGNARPPSLKVVLRPPEAVLGTVLFLSPVLHRLGHAVTGVVDLIRRAAGGNRYNPTDDMPTTAQRAKHRSDAVQKEAEGVELK